MYILYTLDNKVSNKYRYYAYKEVFKMEMKLLRNLHIRQIRSLLTKHIID